MVVNGAHLEDADPAGLEGDDLDDDRQGFNDVQAASQDEEQFRLGQDGHGSQGPTQCQGTRIAHEHLGRMLVIEEEAQAGPGQCRPKDGKMGIAQSDGDDDVGHGRNGAGPGSQAVEAIGQIDGIARADDHDEDEEIVEHPQIDGDGSKWNPQSRREMKKGIEDIAEDSCHDELAGQFLFCRKAQVAVLDGLDAVVEEADDAMAQGQEQSQPFAQVHGVENEARYGQRRQDEDAPHSRRTGFILMALRPFFSFGLAGVEFLQFLDDKRS